VKRDLKFFIRIEKLRKAKKAEKISETELINILKEIFEKYKVIKSQKFLINEIKKRTNKSLPNIKKIRRIIAKLGIKIIYISRKGNVQENCPVCDSPLFEKIYFNLKNEKVVEYYCKVCEYKSNDKRDVPIKFKFLRL